jgi:hypothetical protein
LRFTNDTMENTIDTKAAQALVTKIEKLTASWKKTESSYNTEGLELASLLHQLRTGKHYKQITSKTGEKIGLFGKFCELQFEIIKSQATRLANAGYSLEVLKSDDRVTKFPKNEGSIRSLFKLRSKNSEDKGKVKIATAWINACEKAKNELPLATEVLAEVVKLLPKKNKVTTTKQVLDSLTGVSTLLKNRFAGDALKRVNAKYVELKAEIELLSGVDDKTAGIEVQKTKIARTPVAA